MVVLHGGGWSAVGAARAEAARGDADRWRARGWRTVNATYRACDRSFPDALWIYDRARATYGASLPYCTMGGSAGGHLALMIAAARPEVSCVVAQGAPTDGTTLAEQPAPDPATGGTQLNGPRWVANMMVAAWGKDRLAWFSPAKWPIKARVLAATAAADTLVPFAQAEELRDEQLKRDPNAYVDAFQIPAGGTEFVHARVSSTGVVDLAAREERLIAPLVERAP
jgi:acetyl esterase/lipase